MTVIRHHLPLPLASFQPPAGIEVRGWSGSPADRALVARLAEACRAAAESAGGPAIRPSGLLGELQSRPGRRVDAWLAVEPGATGPADACLGLVTLVETAAGWSLGWLLVHPAGRRQGLARSLVSIAATAARSRGARTLSFETLDRWPEASAFWRSLETGSRVAGADER